MNVKHFLMLGIVFYLFVELSTTQAQGLSVYQDYLNKVYLFDNGTVKQIDHLPLNSYKIGNNSVAFEDNSGNFKIYQHNYVFSASNFVSEYFVSDNLITFRLNSQLKVFDNKQNKNLTTNLGAFACNDDIIVFFDKQERILKAYFNEELYDLADAIAADDISDFTVGEDIAVFKNTEGYYDIFYYGEIIQLLFHERTKSFKAGRGIVAFVEEPMNSFQVFFQGDFLELDTFEPKSYKTGDNMVAYVDNNEYLMCFYNGENITVSFDAPTFYEVHDDLIVFNVQNYFKIFSRGNIYTLESYIPEKYLFNNNILAYIDEHGYLKVFENGSLNTISYEQIKDFEIHGDVVNYTYGVQSQSLYYKGKTYKNN
jgi:hypothetical protein